MPEPTTKQEPTRPTRIPSDLAAKLDELLDVLGLSSAEYLDPLLRVQIENDYKANAKAIRAKRAAEEAIREAREKAARKLEGVELGESGA